MALSDHELRSQADAPASAESAPRVARPVDTAALREAALADLDTQLMLQARSGDRSAAAALIRRNSGRVARYITRLIGPCPAVEDFTQDVFVQVLSKAADYQPTAKFTTWLYRIATNLVLSDRRSLAHRRRSGAGELPDVPDTAQPGPDSQVSLDELRERVARAIQSLPPQQCAAVTLFEYENLTYQQIAAVLDLTEEGVRALLARARARLRTSLNGLL